MKPMRLVLAAMVTMVLAPGASAVEIRDASKKAIFETDLTRAYAACLAPNDQTPEGLPACSPPVTSPCNFSSGKVQIQAISGEPSVAVSADIRMRPASAPCISGTYRLQLALRVTADAPTCSGAACTFRDVTVAKAFVLTKTKAKLQFDLAEILPAGFSEANLEVLDVAVVDPDGIALAAAGVGRAKARKGKTNLTVANTPCTAPNATGLLGPACAPPVRTATCDYDAARLLWIGGSKDLGLRLGARVPRLVGPGACRTGEYRLQSQLRITGVRCTDGVECTLADVPLDLAVPATRGEIEADVIADASGLVRPFDNVELRELRLIEPTSSPLAAAGVGYALRLTKPNIGIARRALSKPDDDVVRFAAVFPRTTLDPTAGAGASFVLHDADGVFYEATIPAAAWQLAGPGRWKYKDKLGAIAGIREASIKARRLRASGARYKVALVAKDVALGAATGPSVTLRVTVAQAGGVGEVTAARNKPCRVTAAQLRCR